jgi:cation:H+ antiporter
MLMLGSSWLVDGASRLALRLGVTPMVVGLTVVGFGTSMPEFTVSLLASLHGSGGLSLGNAVGSNIMNLLLVLGLAAVLAPIRLGSGRGTLRRDLAFGVIPALILMAAAWRGRLDRGPALLLIAVFAVFLILCVHGARGDRGRAAVDTGKLGRHLVLTTAGIALLVAGADLMVRGGVSLAHAMGVSDAVIGLTLVAFGTSLPELATSVTATLKGQADLSVGNVLGSNVFNLGLIVGTAFTVRPAPVPVFVVHQDVPILVGMSLVVGIGVLRRGRISRGGGLAMLAAFATYIAYLVIRGG